MSVTGYDDFATVGGYEKRIIFWRVKKTEMFRNEVDVGSRHMYCVARVSLDEVAVAGDDKCLRIIDCKSTNRVKCSSENAFSGTIFQMKAAPFPNHDVLYAGADSKMMIFKFGEFERKTKDFIVLSKKIHESSINSDLETLRTLHHMTGQHNDMMNYDCVEYIPRWGLGITHSVTSSHFDEPSNLLILAGSRGEFSAYDLRKLSNKGVEQNEKTNSMVFSKEFGDMAWTWTMGVFQEDQNLMYSCCDNHRIYLMSLTDSNDDIVIKKELITNHSYSLARLKLDRNYGLEPSSSIHDEDEKERIMYVIDPDVSGQVILSSLRLSIKIFQSSELSKIPRILFFLG